MRLRLTLAYNGAAFSGWQSQRGGGGVQDALETAFRALCDGRIIVHESGRTDAGVHALGQCAHVDVPDGRLPLGSWMMAVNARLPREVRVMRVQRASPDFHARFSASGKIYRYTIWNGPVLPPHLLDRAWLVPGTFDGERLAEACRIFTGRHDFAAFCARASKAAEPTTRTITGIRVRRQGALWTLTFEGEGFLYKMVRMLTGSAVRCAAGRIAPGDLRVLLERAGPRTSYVAPAGGLCLVRVRY
jgi:tRNA pseudouridine38-40 synthase